MVRYSAEVEGLMKSLYESLSEKDRRRYVGIEAEKLGHGGIEYVAAVVGCDSDTVARGKVELAQLPTDDALGRVRKKGGTQVLS